MFSKQFSAFLKRILNVLCACILKMCNSERKDGGKPPAYSFKPFSYERVNFHLGNDKIPHPRSGHRIGADSSNFYSFGGYNPLIRLEEYHYEDDSYIDSYPLFQELWKFNFASKRWTKFANSPTLPKELVSNAVILHHNVLMVYGGTGSPFGTRCSNQLYVCNVNDESSPMVEVKTAGQLPLPQYGQAIIYHNDYLYAIGGTTGYDYTCDIHRLNLKTLTWEIVYICNGTGDYEPPGRYRHEVGFDGKRIFILAGGTADTVYDLADIPAFDVEKKMWISEKTVPAGKHGVPMARRCHGAAQIDHGNGIEVFITGGLDGESIFQDLWRLNLKSLQWTYFETCVLPRPTYFHALAVTPQGRLYVFGGIYSIDEEVKRSNAVYSTWVCIPKLSELCWEAVLQYSPRIFKYSSADLINIGLPRHFVQRLGDKKLCKY
ncbi:kelch domain-containing protein 10 homolog [Euwallacea similis]|uniref:kelch domain-containing protein 10 homolog n=1 Tax=Euwallacea similis TaxID=1736056 RepID=UPI00344EF669